MNSNKHIYQCTDGTDIAYDLIRSKRKTISVEIRPDCSVAVRAPLRCRQREIDLFVRDRENWIKKNLAKMREKHNKLTDIKPLSQAELSELSDRAAAYIPERVAYYAPIVGVDCGRITIRNQKTRWGSCSSRGNLNFNCLLMLAPPEVIDSVVVHELCHRKEMNHSPKFYDELLRVYPDYHKWNRWLKENGQALLAMNPK